MDGLDVREKSTERVASSGGIADIRKGLHKRSVDLDAARAFVQKLKLKQPLGFADGARIAKFILRILGPSGIRELFAAKANSIPGPGSRYRARRVRLVWGHASVCSFILRSLRIALSWIMRMWPISM
jgi:hypothetical protein